jgi:hypothetical protein
MIALTETGMLDSSNAIDSGLTDGSHDSGKAFMILTPL